MVGIGHPYAHMSKTGYVHKHSKTKKISLKYYFFLVSKKKTVLGNVVWKFHAKFHLASLIKKRFQIEGTKSLTKKPKILFMERYWHISKPRKNIPSRIKKSRFSATYSYCPGESIEYPEKRLLL